MPKKKKNLQPPGAEPFASPLAVPKVIAESDNLPAAKMKQAFPIVGIGASAGGLAAFAAFFAGLPKETELGMAFVLVPHLAPDHKSILVDLIQRSTGMPTIEVEDGMSVMPNRIYIIPPNRDMALLNGTLQLLEPAAPRGQRLPIDFFFRSLAQDQHERAIGIVLSGTGSDGTLGIRAIKGEGGIVMAQQPDSAEYDGMPRSAIATGIVDYELSPAALAAQLVAFVTHAFSRPRQDASATPPKDETELHKIVLLLRNQTGHDFSEYKPSTILRRIERRMAVMQIETMGAYIKYLQQSPTEVASLFRDMLIGVTNFFRDAEAFLALEQKVIPKLFVGQPTGKVIRVWVPGCATGEEAYSIAILLQEQLTTLKQACKVQIFATDIDGQAIAKARVGLYPASIAADISAERLARFFVAELDGSAYRIHKNIRDMLIFSEHSVIKDPPFSKLNLISCRNFMIYVDVALQRRLIPLFHYALKPDGFLFLGTSESVGQFADLFEMIDRKAKLYRRKEDMHGLQRNALGRFLPVMTAREVPLSPLPGKTVAPARMPLRELTEKALLQEIAPSGALVDAQGDILYLHGRTGKFLEPTPGEAGINNILKMARQGLRRELATALHQAVATREVVRCPSLRVKTNGDFSTVNLTIRQLKSGSTSGAELNATMMPGTPLYLVVLEETAPNAGKQEQPATVAAGAVAGSHDHEAEACIAQLNRELQDKEEYLQSTTEELETANEELKSAYEEMQSVNEELQSTNEEMETSKEELQSVNEELTTVNVELQAKVADLSRVNNDMNNLLAGTGIATVFVDHQLRIMRFTPAATQIINLIAGDVGRPVAHIVSNLVGYDRLVADAQGVLDTLLPKEIVVQTMAERWYKMSIQPYRTLDNVIEGVVVNFVDITEIKQAETALRRLAVVVRDAYDAITVQALDGRLLAWNQGAERVYGWNTDEALRMNVRDLIPENLRAMELDAVKRLARADVLAPYRTQRVSKDGRIVEVWLTATALVNATGEIYAIATTERLLEAV